MFFMEWILFGEILLFDERCESIDDEKYEQFYICYFKMNIFLMVFYIISVFVHCSIRNNWSLKICVLEITFIQVSNVFGVCFSTNLESHKQKMPFKILNFEFQNINYTTKKKYDGNAYVIRFTVNNWINSLYFLRSTILGIWSTTSLSS